MRRTAAIAAILACASLGCVPMMTTGARTFEETTSAAIGLSLPVPIVWNTPHYQKQPGVAEKATFVELSIQGSSLGNDEVLLESYYGFGFCRNIGPVFRDPTVWEGVSLGACSMSYADDSVMGFYVGAATFNVKWGGVLLRYTFAPDVDGSTASWGTTGATIAYWWGWIPTMVMWEIAGDG